jgi:hypothetical protein
VCVHSDPLLLTPRTKPAHSPGSKPRRKVSSALSAHSRSCDGQHWTPQKRRKAAAAREPELFLFGDSLLEVPVLAAIPVCCAPILLVEAAATLLPRSVGIADMVVSHIVAVAVPRCCYNQAL